ncbi:hypothetical protein CH363_13195 [Leptospira haakeii]|uniref:Cytochrome B n=1 Tax=Leptospira haakeii TaxID=2023198 RepID=A0ABX4PL41_9LEPT|nr:hypothetical protein CH363_13195 [Leptospira haakeii]PKA18982.1 hypothetical protein CH377_15090 [Leptospira haakeii]
MYPYLLIIHSHVRWVVLVVILISISLSLLGFLRRRSFGKIDDLFRILVISLSHLQLVIGFTLYFYSPIVRSFFANKAESILVPEARFFGSTHISLMIASVILLTLGSAIAKRKTENQEKFKSLLFWFITSLLLIFIAIPWPFSPFVERPYFRGF